jgi:hypothetical protein
VAALLESLYYDTPCGTIILWRPENIDQHGVPFVEANTMSHLIVDGQQRTRSVYAAFKGLFEGTEVAAEEAEEGAAGQAAVDGDDGTEHYWAINLNEVDEFNGLLHRPATRVWPMFAAIPDPARAEERRVQRERENQKANKPRWNVPESPFKYNFVPLRFFNEPDFETLLRNERLFLKGADGTPLPNGGPGFSRLLDTLEGLRTRVHQMQQRRLFRKDLGRISLDKALRVFIRINSGGRPVQEEEKGFSLLVGARSSTHEWVKAIFRRVHRDSTPSGDSRLKGRDEALERLNERQFGFKLFIRVFVLAVTYHTGRPVTARGLSFAALRDRAFLQILEPHGDTYEQLWTITSDAVVAMRQLLREHLRLDAIRFLPDTQSLLPLFLCLIKYPELMTNRGSEHVAVRPEFCGGIARAALLLLLKGPTQQQVMKWTATVATAHRHDAVQALEHLARDVGVSEVALGKNLQSANSLTNRYTLLQYALERSRNAKDFSYKKNGLSGADFDTSERELSDACKPEKQHIVPYSRLIDAYGLEFASRVSSTEANNIGNITYISGVLNSFKGFSDKFAELIAEAEDGENLARHFISKDALSAYGETRVAIENDPNPDPKKVRQLYEKWIACRREELVGGFVGWAGELEQQWRAQSAERQRNQRVEPVRPLLCGPSKPYLLRSLQLPDPVEDELLTLFESDGWKIVPKTGGEGGDSLALSLEDQRRKVVKGVSLSRRALVVPGTRTRPPRTIQFDDGLDNVLKALRELPDEFKARKDEKRGEQEQGAQGSGSRVRRTRQKTTLPALLDHIERAGPGARKTAESLFGLADGYVTLGESSASFKVKNSQTKKPCTLFVVTREATFYIGFLSKWEENAQVGADLARTYRQELTETLGKDPYLQGISLIELERHLNRVLDTVGRAAALLFAAVPTIQHQSGA